MTLPTNIVNGTAGHAGLHNATNTQVNTNTTDIATLVARVPSTPLLVSNNLSDVTAATARTNLGLGGAAVKAIGTTASDVAAGDEPLAVKKSLVTAKGDLLIATASGTVTNLAVGANDKTLVADSAAATGHSWKDKSFFSQFPPFKPVTGEFVISPTTSTSTAAAYTSGKMFLSPIDIPVATTFDRIGCNVSTVGTGTALLCRLGIYSDSGDFSRPSGAPLLDAGTVDPTSGTGDKLVTISQTLQPGRYWLALAFNGTISGSPTMVISSLINQQGLVTLGNSSSRCWGYASVSGALPTISIGSLYRDTNCPMIGLRAA